MEVVYQIETMHGKRDYDNVVFKKREDCEKIIIEWAVSKYGNPDFAEDSEEVEQINSYWNGDISSDELAKMQIGYHEKAMSSALFYDYLKLYYIKELKVFD